MLKELNKIEKIPTRMKAIITLGLGDLEQLQLREVPTPQASPDEVLIQVLAAGVNNTDINTRIGWYSSSFTGSTEACATTHDMQTMPIKDAGWNGATPFPLIQGTDCCGRVVQVGSPGHSTLLGQRVLVRPCVRPKGFFSRESIWMASDFNGAFAQYVKVPASEVFPVQCDLTDGELASIPCAYGTSENMILRTAVSSQDHVLITGGSGGIGIASLQLCKIRGARVTSIVGKTKMKQVQELGADAVIAREDSLLEFCQSESIDVVIDNVGGSQFPNLLRVLKRGGRYTSSGAIGGPLVTLDLRTIYLKDITLLGCTAWDEPVFPNLIRYIQAGQLRPRIDKTFPLEQIAQAQTEFLRKNHIGKMILVPPHI